MSTAADTADRLAGSTHLTREDLLAMLEDGVEEAARKVSEGRIRDESKEEIRVRQWKSLAYMCRAYDDILTSAEEAANVRERIEALEDLTGVR